MKVIRVTALAWVAFMFGCMISASCHAEGASFSWLPNSETDLAGYKIHYGAATREYTEVKDCGLPDTENGRVACQIEVVPDGNTYFAATAYDQSGGESDYSDEVVFDPPPDRVMGILLTVVVINASVSMSQ